MRVMLAVLTLLLIGGCAPANSQSKDRNTVEGQQEIYASRQPVPRFEYSQDRDTLIQIYRLRNEVRPTFTTFHSNGTGDVVFSCPSRGYAIPADTQLTNGLQPWCYGQSCGGAVIEQPEPNGLYSSKNTDGTWVLCVRDNGEVTPVYTELKVTTFPFLVNADGHTVSDSKSASSTTVTLRNAQGTAPGNAPVASPEPVR